MIEKVKYKDSGFIFLGNIPESWDTYRLKELGYLQNGISKGGDYFGYGFPFVSYGDIYNDQVESSKINGLANSTKEDQKLYSVKAGDVFFTRTSETIDEIGISSTCVSTIAKATFSGFTIRFRPTTSKLYKGFSKYFFKAHVNRLYLTKQISLVTRASLGQGILANLPVLIPPIDEQTQIANYLDRKTQAIDKKAELLKQKIDKYKELRKSLINQTITKGLNRNIELKESGIEWIGKIPKHWEVKRLKDIGFLYSGLSGKSGDDFNQDENSDNRGFLPFTNIASNTYIDIENFGKVIINKGEKQNKIKKHDIFFLMSSEGYEDLGKAALLIDDIPETYLNSFCKGFRITNNQVLPKYLNWMLFASVFRETLLVQGKGFTRINLKMEKINDFEIILPTQDEQKEIAQYLDTKTSLIDSIIANIEKQMTGLAELRKTLINDVVSGKLKVSGNS